MIGINLSGAEFGGSRNRYGYDYIYPSERDLDFYDSKGVELIRLPFTWERMQNTINGELNQDELGRMKHFLAEAEERGMEVIVDLHNFGRFNGAVLGSPAVPNSAFADFWQKLANELKGEQALLGYDLMNEPHDMGGATVWPSAAQAAVDAIRTVDMTTAIYVEGDGWANAHNWSTSSNASLHIQDPADNIVYEAHVYFDRDKTGTYKYSYDQEGAYPDIGVDRVQSFLDWLDANNYKGFVGEFAVPNNDPRWLPVLDNVLAELQVRGVDGAYWGAGSWWGDYPMALVGKDGSENPQLGVLDDYFPPLEIITGSDATNELVGGMEGDPLVGKGGNDRLLGFGGDDVLRGDAGDDYLDGGDGADRLVGGSGSDKLFGRSGRDVLSGGDHYDVLDGGADDDVLIGGSYNDVLTGGLGADQFVFGRESHRDKITDFDPSEDQIFIVEDSINLRRVLCERHSGLYATERPYSRYNFQECRSGQGRQERRRCGRVQCLRPNHTGGLDSPDHDVCWISRKWPVGRGLVHLERRGVSPA